MYRECRPMENAVGLEVGKLDGRDFRTEIKAIELLMLCLKSANLGEFILLLYC